MRLVTIDARETRARSIASAHARGLEVSVGLPLLECDGSARPIDEVCSRLLAMNAVAAVAYGFDRKKALAWLASEELQGELTPAERRFVADGAGPARPFQAQIEGMWALAWAAGLVPALDFGRACDDRFSFMLPDLKVAAPGAVLRARARLRSAEELWAACDLAYCLHAAITSRRLAGGAVTPPNPTWVIERRRALEWLLGGDAWDEVSLDT